MTDRGIEIWNLGFEGLKALAVVIGAGWAAWRFRRERVHSPQIEFSINARFYGPINGAYAAEYTFMFENKGRVRVEVKRIELRVRGIKVGQELHMWKKLPPRAEFSELIVDDKSVIPSTFGHTYFEPGIKQEYRYVSIVPADIILVLVRGQFFREGHHSHSAECVSSVRQEARHV